MTVKFLEDTKAVLSLGKLCEDHGSSYEWTGGRKPHLVKNGKWIQCNTENYVPIVVTGLSTTSSSTSSSTPTPPTSATQDIEDSIPDPAPIECESEDRQARGTPLHEPDEIPKPNKFMNHEYARRDPLQSDISEWLQEFRENIVDERVPEHRDLYASSSHGSSLEPQKNGIGQTQYENSFPEK